MGKRSEFINSSKRFFEFETFSASKDPARPERNEDRIGSDENTVIVADGATPKAGNSREIAGRSGGQIAADVAVQTALDRPDLTGRRLVDAMTSNLAAFYRDHNPEAAVNDQATFATTFVVARILEEADELIITRVGDTRYRINGGEPIYDEREADERDVQVRAAEMRRLVEAGVDIETAATLGREKIKPSLNEQWRLWNNSEDPLGFGYLNGRPVPDTFVHEERYRLSEVRTLEIWSDGYPKPAAKPTIDSWEAAFDEVQTADPYRYLAYPATKTADDRTVAILRSGR